MKQSTRIERAKEIEAIALQILETQGYDGLSILSVARAAKASNETLYRWYGNKIGLIEALIARNTGIVGDALAKSEHLAAVAALRDVGPVLLAMLLSESAIALNRAAATDGTGTLGQALAKSGRDTVAPWIISVMQRGIENGELSSDNAYDMAEVYFALLIGDKQVRRVTGALPRPSAESVSQMACVALDRFLRLYSGDVGSDHLDDADHND